RRLLTPAPSFRKDWPRNIPTRCPAICGAPGLLIDPVGQDSSPGCPSFPSSSREVKLLGPKPHTRGPLADGSICPLFVSDHSGNHLLCPGSLSGAPVRLSRRSRLLLSPPASRPAGMASRSLTALGTRRERRGSPAGESVGRGTLSREVDLRGLLVSVGGADLHHCPRGSRLRGHVDHDARLERIAVRCVACRPGLRVRRSGAAPVLQRDLSGRRRMDATGISPRPSLVTT